MSRPHIMFFLPRFKENSSKRGGKVKRPKLPVQIGAFTLDYFYNTGHPAFGVYEGSKLVCVCVYRCGAEEVIRRLNNQPREDANLLTHCGDRLRI